MIKEEKFRKEKDTIGEIEVPEERYYGAQTQRSIQNFSIGVKTHKMLPEILQAMLYIKKAAALANREIFEDNPSDTEYTKYSIEIAEKIIEAVEEILSKFEWFYENEFPLVIWQTGSGTQTNMNVNEVVASVANEKVTGKKGGKTPIHPNDHVNLGQSSNDTFPTAMHVSAIILIFQKLIPSLHDFHKALVAKSEEFKDIVKIGRTHTQDATPITLGQEFSAYAAQIKDISISILQKSFPLLYIAQGGTAVGTGLNCHKNFPEKFAKKITEVTNIFNSDNKFDEYLKIDTELQFKTASNKFKALSCNDELLDFHGSLNSLAGTLFKITNDIRFLASGPRSGLGELSLPENEPGSSIMPGKVNPTQCEALSMIASQVMGNQTAVTIGCASGHFELNVFRPLIIKNVIDSINLLAEGIDSFRIHCLTGIEANKERIKQLLEQSLMLVTALNPYIGYETAANLAKNAHKKNFSLKESAKDLGLLTQDGRNGTIKEADWENIMDAKKMVG